MHKQISVVFTNEKEKKEIVNAKQNLIKTPMNICLRDVMCFLYSDLLCAQVPLKLACIPKQSEQGHWGV